MLFALPQCISFVTFNPIYLSHPSFSHFKHLARGFLMDNGSGVPKKADKTWLALISGPPTTCCRITLLAKNYFVLENIIVIDAYISVCFQLPFVILPFRLINSSPREEYMSYYSPFHFWLVFSFIHLYMRQEVTYCKKDMQIRNYVDFFQNLSEVIKLDSY